MSNVTVGSLNKWLPIIILATLGVGSAWIVYTVYAEWKKSKNEHHVEQATEQLAKIKMLRQLGAPVDPQMIKDVVTLIEQI